MQTPITCYFRLTKNTDITAETIPNTLSVLSLSRQIAIPANVIRTMLTEPEIGKTTIPGNLVSAISTVFSVFCGCLLQHYSWSENPVKIHLPVPTNVPSPQKLTFQKTYPSQLF